MLAKGRQAGMLVLLLVPGAILVFLSFRSGGFGPGPPAVAAVAVAGLLVLRLALAERPFAALAPAHALAGGALAALAAWTWLSGSWSGAGARALTEYDRVLLYLLLFALFATVERTPERLRWILRGLFIGVLLVCLAGLVSRVLPELVTVEPIFDNRRLRYPLESWNGVGFLAAFGVVLALHLTTSDREPRALRVMGAGAVPLLAAALLFTYSRAGAAAAFLGVATYCLLAWQRGLLPGLLATGPTTVVAVLAAHGADLLTSQEPATPAAIAQGRDLAPVLVGAALAAGVLRALLLPVDRAAPRISFSARQRRILTSAATAGAVVLALATTLMLDVPDRVFSDLSSEQGSRLHGDVQGRFGQLTLGRMDHYRLAIKEWREEPLHGQGAGTFEVLWNRDPPIGFGAAAVDGHSLYIETLGELGTLGLLLIVVYLGSIVVALARLVRGPDRAIYAAALAVTLMWTVHAGVHWDWELTALTAWLFAVAGLGLAREPEAATSELSVRSDVALRGGVALACVAAAVVPGLIALSEAHLAAGTRALVRGNCTIATREARDVRSLLRSRPESYALLGYCELQSGRNATAAGYFRAAARRDPWNWRYRYPLAVSRAAAGKHPQAAARATRRLQSTEPIAQGVLRRLEAAHVSNEWKSIASRAPLPLDDRVLGHGERFIAWRCGVSPYGGAQKEAPRPVRAAELGPVSFPPGLCPRS
jgi:hypothetical protein